MTALLKFPSPKRRMPYLILIICFHHFGQFATVALSTFLSEVSRDPIVEMIGLQ
jgi:hypothetical protein